MNFEEFVVAIDEIRDRHRGETVCFFSGYDGDSLGPFRLPAPFFRRMEREYPEEPLLAGPLVRREDGLVSYRTELEGELLEFCRRELLRHLSPEKLFSCVEPGERIA